MFQALSSALLGALSFLSFLPLYFYAEAPPAFDEPIRCEVEAPAIADFAPLFASKVFGFTATGYSTSATTPSSGCHPTDPHCTYDGTLDWGGTSGATVNEDDDDQEDDHTISGGAVNAWEGSGSIDLEVAWSYSNYQNGSTGLGFGSVVQLVYVGFSLDVSYQVAGGGTVTYTRQAHPSAASAWTFDVPAYNGQLASVDFTLQMLTDATVKIENLSTTTCTTGTAYVSTDIDAELWRL